MAKIITPSELDQLQKSSSEIHIIDVRLEEDFKKLHIKNATSICAFEVSFSEKIISQFPDKNNQLIVYGQSEESHEARVSADKLIRLGYSNILELRSGICGWQLDGFESIGTNQEIEKNIIPNGKHPIDFNKKNNLCN